jgi:lysophospholipase L1-like esterase
MIKYILTCLLLPLSIFASTKVAIIGDSISIGLLATPGNSYIDLLRNRYATEGKDIVILNRSYGGAMTDTLFNIAINTMAVDYPDYYITFLGINDAGQNVPQATLLNNFATMMAKCTVNSKRVILGGVYCTFNPAYNTTLVNVYVTLINTFNCYPVLLLSPDALAGSPDGIHPNNAGHALIAQYIYDALDAVGAY